MTKLLLWLFIKDADKTEDLSVRSSYGKLAGITGTVCNVLLFLAKLTAALVSGSISILADAINNLSDAGSSIITFFGFRMAGKEADAEHPYGHARMEYLSALAIAALILLVGVELFKSSFGCILSPKSVKLTYMTVGILVLSIAVKFWMMRFAKYLGNRIQSTALLAVSADSRNDVLSTAVVIVSALIEHYTSWRLDGWIGLGLALFILRNGFQIGKETVNALLGQAPDPQLVKMVANEILAHEKVLGIHDLMVHDYGPGRRFASVHVEMDCKEPVLGCHDIIDEIERDFLKKFNIHLVIHYDPVVSDDKELNRMRGLVSEELKKIDRRLSLHDFRMVRGPHHTNLIFDVSVPFDLMKDKAELKKKIDDCVQFQDHKYYAVVTFEAACIEKPGS